jgi:uncharacterized protein YjlB
MSSSGRELKILQYFTSDDRIFPNNRLPAIVYKSVLDLSGQDPAANAEELFEGNNWRGTWRNGIFNYHHYHSNTHEVLGIYSGNAQVQLGGPNGSIIEIEKGDVIVIPAGVAHKNIAHSSDFACVGAYPGGKKPDMNYGNNAERPRADVNIKCVPLPANDPVLGGEGILLERWHM